MKRMLVRIMLLCIVVCTVNSCFVRWFTSLFESDTQCYRVHLYIKNCSKKELSINREAWYDGPILLHHGDSVHIIERLIDENAPFDIVDLGEYIKEEFCISVSSSDGTLLKEWRYEDARDENCQFFNGQYWKRYNYVEITDGNYAWKKFTFEITPEILNAPENQPDTGIQE